MSTFLELSQALHRECGAAGVAPTAVTNQTGENARLVNWVVEADYKVQTKWINWKFLRAAFTAGNTTSAGTATLAKPATLKTWDLASFRIVYPGETEENPMEAVEHEPLKGVPLDTTEAPPQRVVVMPDNSLYFEPVPDGVYTILADYYIKPTRMAANATVSLIPEEFHYSVILGQAMIFYSNFESAPEIKMQGLELYTAGLAELENHQLPNQNYSRNRTGGGFEVVGGQFADDFGVSY